MAEPQSLLTLKAAHQQRRMPRYQRIVRWSWRLLVFGLVAGLVFFIAITFAAIPSFFELENPRSALASEVLADNGRDVLGRYFIQNRVPIAYEDLGKNLVQALVATEDERFWRHSGVDAQAVLRVVVRTVMLRDQSAGGGSTITQQLAKNLYSDRDFKGMNKFEKLFALAYRKLREWMTAIKLEKRYTKEEIIAMYFNQCSFINNAYGIHAAAEVYFGKKPADLNVQEAATLVGMLQNPSYFNPLKYKERCLRRRMIVLFQMYRNEFLTEAQYDSIKVLPLDMSRFKKVSFTEDKAPYMCDELEKDVKAILDTPEARKPDGTTYNLYRDGLRIYTTIDPIYQQHAEEAMREHMAKLQLRFFQVWRGRDPWTFRSGKANDEEIKARKESLWDLVRSGDRFLTLWPKYFDNISAKIQDKYGFDLRDADIKRMMQEAEKPGTLSRMVADSVVSAQTASSYRRIMASRDWPTIQNQWSAIHAAVKKIYDTPVRMKVFSWKAPELERDTIMSPLDSLKYSRMHLQTGLLAVDPVTSQIKAWVGGINFRYFQFDHIRSMRQVGSTFKPFVYATAIAQQGISPCFQVYDIPVTIPAHYQNFTNVTDWTPKDSDGKYSGRLLTLKEALKGSVNSVSAYLMKQMGDTEPVRGLVNNMGIDSAARRSDGDYRIPKQPSICLGAADLTVMEMTGAYSTFANNGVYFQPYIIKEIKDKNGRLLYRAQPEEHFALPPNANYVMLQMLKYNVTGAPGINQLKSEIGGKTGTTQNFTDGWFMGVTPSLVVGTWVGGEDRWIRFLSLADGQGSRMARPIVAGFFQRLEKDKNSKYDFNARFKRPPGELGIELNCAAYKDSIPMGGNSDEEEFAPDIYEDQVTPGQNSEDGAGGTPKSNPTTPPPPANTPGTGPVPGVKKPPVKKPDEGFGG